MNNLLNILVGDDVNMSKYTYESVKAINIDVTNAASLEGLTTSARLNPDTFCQHRLTDKSPEQQANILYSAVRDLGGDQNHPIVKAFESYMQKNGFDKSKLDEIVLDSMTDAVPAKKQEKQKAPEEILDPAIGAPALREGYDSYKHVKVIDEQNLQKKADLEKLAETNPAEFAKTILKGKSPEQQADILYSAALELGDGLHPVVTALSSQMKKANIASDTTLENIALAGVLSIDGPKVEKTLGKKVSAPEIQPEELGAIEAASELERVKKAIIVKREEQEIGPNTPEKFQAEVTTALQEKLGRPLKIDEREQVQYLAHDLEHVNDGQAMTKLDKGLESILNVTGLKASDIAPVTKLVENYHPEGPQKVSVLSALESFNAVHEHDGREEQEIDAPTTRRRSNALTGHDDPRAPHIEDTGPKARDSVMFVESGPAKALASSASEVDPITEAVRKEILAKQQQLLKTEIAATDPSVTAMNSQAFRDYLITPKGKEEAAKVFAKPEMQTALNKIEVEGYREVHTQFQGSFKNVNWAPDQAVGADQPKTKSCEIRNDEGQVVANIKETTHDKAPTAVTLENGDTVNVKSYRTIEFPKALETGKGPLHLSMAVKDENGKNISEKDAVYFTAHYDDKGQLTEVSSPVPVKFKVTGNKEIDDNAVGYIERNGKVYTLPVTKKNYDTMMKEVAKNKGMGVDLSQEAEKPAQDLVMTKPKTVEPVLEKEKVEELTPKTKEKSVDSVLVEQEPVPLKIVLPSGLTGAEKTEQIDKALKGATSEQIVATLKDQVTKGGSEIVGLIVESTKPDRTGSHPDVPKLTPEQFKEVYDVGMKSAKAIGDAPPKSTALNMTENLKLNVYKGHAGS